MNGRGVRVTVLGSGQDGGLPQAAAAHRLDESARHGVIPERTGPSLLVESGDRMLLCDVSPDFRLQWWNRTSLPDAVALTHGHIGHYAGLVHFGTEVSAATGVELHVTNSMLHFLRANAPWNALLDAGRLRRSEAKWNDTTIELIPVPHRAEFTDTVAVSVGGRVLWLPDIDDWGQWPDAETVVGSHELAFLDGTFWSPDELAGRSVAEVPHPMVPDTIERFAHLETKIVLTHLNHTNPLCDPASPESALVHRAGMQIAFDGMTVDI